MHKVPNVCVVPELGHKMFRKVIDDAENIPVPLNFENVKSNGEERLLQIRTNPPSPQCFSASHAPVKTTPSKSSKSRLMVCDAARPSPFVNFSIFTIY